MKDYVIKATSGNGQVRAYVGITKNLVQTARDNHNTIKVATAALGRTLTATAMMGLMMKNENDELSVIIKGGGPIGTILTTADSKGNVKGYVQYPDLNGVQVEDYPNGKLNVAGAVGKDGYVKVIRALCWFLSISKWRNSRRLYSLLCIIRANSISSITRSSYNRNYSRASWRINSTINARCNRRNYIYFRKKCC